MRDPRPYLEYIRDSIELVERYTEGGETAFMSDTLIQDAVLRRMETLADAASHLSGELKSRHLDVTWRKIGDFRNIQAHGYIRIQLDRVWHTVIEDLPRLREIVEAELRR